ncbi:ATP-binding SpoIIE family protein phosphatase [Streptomyces sp. NPDC015130]|uniref:ATP-binding SpoIIE family protein phosphatase n=1 Tax=Streptomyces sp. NPDC015130 TaxID=3364940 RepID=UPI0036FB6848
MALSSGRVALVIGDVMGHGLAEAATMGRLRIAVRTLADLELAPDDLLVHLNDLVSDLGEDLYATCLYAVYDPTDAGCTFASAGHPPPVLVDPSGTARFVDLEPNSPLGGAEPPFETSRLHVPDGSLLVLYTDGLAETSVRPMSQGLELLRTTLDEALAHEPWHLDELVTVTELIVSELVTNAVRYGRGPIRLRLLRSDALVCEVSDGSLTTPHVRRAAETDEGGRGLQLVTALSDRWGARYETAGKYVWTEQQLPGAAATG